MRKIKDELIEPFTIWVEPDCNSVGIEVETKDSKGDVKYNLNGAKYFPQMYFALEYIAKKKIAMNDSVTTLREHQEEYRNLLNSFKESILG